MPELVSCIMPTRNRPHFFRQALRCFLRQSYRQSELIVLDDGEQPVEETCAGLPQVRYVRLRRRTLTGTKMNLGVELARGDILQKLDDDDYYHPEFLKTAVAHLPARNRARSVVAWDCFLILLAGDKQPRFSGHGWNAGGTLCFPRKLWDKGPFRDVRTGYDSWFLRDHRPRIVRVCAPEYYLVVRHGRNTWRWMQEGDRADDFLGAMPVYHKSLEQLVGREDRAFYRSLVWTRRGQ